jgi:hypothetical protein
MFCGNPAHFLVVAQRIETAKCSSGNYESRIADHLWQINDNVAAGGSQRDVK